MALIFLIVIDSPVQADHGGPHEGTTPTSRLNASLRLSLVEGEKAPSFQLINHEGKTITLDDLKGRPIFLSLVNLSHKYLFGLCIYDLNSPHPFTGDVGTRPDYCAERLSVVGDYFSFITPTKREVIFPEARIKKIAKFIGGLLQASTH